MLVWLAGLQKTTIVVSQLAEAAALSVEVEASAEQEIRRHEAAGNGPRESTWRKQERRQRVARKLMPSHRAKP